MLFTGDFVTRFAPLEGRGWNIASHILEWYHTVRLQP